MKITAKVLMSDIVMDNPALAKRPLWGFSVVGVKGLSEKEMKSLMNLFASNKPLTITIDDERPERTTQSLGTSEG